MDLVGHEPCRTTDPADSEPAGLHFFEDLVFGTAAEGGDLSWCKEILTVLHLEPGGRWSTLEGQDVVPGIAEKPIAAPGQEKALLLHPPEEGVASALPAPDQALSVKEFEIGFGCIRKGNGIVSHIALRLVDGGDKGKTSSISKRVNEIQRCAPEMMVTLPSLPGRQFSDTLRLCFED
jgi:hypothetical protein